jgi:hypothetical protein
MVRQLFGDFLENETSYRASEKYWSDLLREIEQVLGQVREWESWIPRHYADGTTPIETPGNPICEARSQKFDRAFRLIQHAPTDDDLDVSAWIKRYPEDEGYDRTVFPADELFVALSLSEESVQIARDLLTKWMTPGTTVEDMDVFIRERIHK